MAAFEGHFKSDGGGAPLYLFGFPDEESRTVRGGLAIPGMLSFLIHESFTRPVPGLLDLSEDENDWPPLGMTFQTYHLMVAMGMFQIGISSLALLLLWRKRLFEQRWLLWTFVFAVVTPYVSNHAGWMAAEIGRQPWVVQGLLRTADGVSKNVSAGQILGSILMFGFVYLMLFLVDIRPQQQDSEGAGHRRGAGGDRRDEHGVSGGRGKPGRPLRTVHGLRSREITRPPRGAQHGIRGHDDLPERDMVPPDRKSVV